MKISYQLLVNSEYTETIQENLKKDMEEIHQEIIKYENLGYKLIHVYFHDNHIQLEFSKTISSNQIFSGQNTEPQLEEESECRLCHNKGTYTRGENNKICGCKYGKMLYPKQ